MLAVVGSYLLLVCFTYGLVATSDDTTVLFEGPFFGGLLLLCIRRE